MIMPSTSVGILPTTDNVLPSVTVSTIDDHNDDDTRTKNQSDCESIIPKMTEEHVETSVTELSSGRDSEHSLDSSSHSSVNDHARLSGDAGSATSNILSNFLCFQDPIVAPDGETYERVIFLKEHEHEDITSIVLYPNRALKVILEDFRLGQSDSIHASLRKWHYKTKKAISGYLHDPSSSSDDTAQAIDNATDSFPLSDGFYCPITCNIMYDPVIDPDGNTFERVVVENWIRLHGTSPTTRRKMTIEGLRPNRILQRILEEEKKLPPDVIRPEIRKWMQEEDTAAPKASDVEYGGTLLAEASSAEQRLQAYRRRAAFNQAFFNLVGVIICLLLLKYLRKIAPYGS